MFSYLASWFRSAPTDDGSNQSVTEATGDARNSVSRSTKGGSEPQGPKAVKILYGKHEIPLEFNEIDFEAEENPKEGITVDNLKWAVSRALTPYIFGDAKKPGLQSRSANIRPSSTINANKITVTFNGKKLDEPKKTLKSYGIKTNDKLIAIFDSNTASTAAAAAAAERTKQAKGGSKGGKSKKGGKKKSNKKPTQQDNSALSSTGNQREITNMSTIPRSFPKKPLTAREKIAKVLEDVEKEIVPLVDKFVANVPKDAQQRKDDHHIISESLLQKMLLLDDVDTAEEEAEPHEITLRQTRKNAVNIMHQYMAKADEAAKAEAENNES